jgi:integrase
VQVLRIVAWRRSNRGGYKAFLHHVGGGRRAPTRPLRLRQGRHLSRTLNEEQVLALVEACEHLRDQFLVVLLVETGMRLGQALGLHHSDFISHLRRADRLRTSPPRRRLTVSRGDADAPRRTDGPPR